MRLAGAGNRQILPPSPASRAWSTGDRHWGKLYAKGPHGSRLRSKAQVTRHLARPGSVVCRRSPATTRYFDGSCALHRTVCRRIWRLFFAKHQYSTVATMRRYLPLHRLVSSAPCPFPASVSSDAGPEQARRRSRTSASSAQPAAVGRCLPVPAGQHRAAPGMRDATRLWENSQVRDRFAWVGGRSATMH